MLLGLIGKISAIAIAGSAIASPLIVKHLNTSNQIQSTEKEVNEANCGIVMTVTMTGSDDQHYLLACKDTTDSTHPAKFYLNKKGDNNLSEEVKSFKRESGSGMKITFTLYKDNQTKEMNLSKNSYDQLNDVELKKHCKVEWNEGTTARKHMVCQAGSTNNYSQYLDRLNEQVDNE